MQALFSTFLRLYIIFFAAGQTKKFGGIMRFSGLFVGNFAPFSGIIPIFLLGMSCLIWMILPREVSLFRPFTPLSALLSLQKFFRFPSSSGTKQACFWPCPLNYNINSAPTQSPERYFSGLFRFFLSPSRAPPSWETASALISSPCSRQNA